MADIFVLEDDPEIARLVTELCQEIGYSVVSRTTLALVFAAFLATTLALGLVLRRTRRPELLGWLAPVAALGTAAVLATLGESSRRTA